jgi:tellurite resistance protein
VVPLVQVAWADGSVRPEERAAIIQAARDAGIESKGGHYPLLEHWLDERPSRQMLEAWEHYVQGLCKQLTPEEVAKLKSDTLKLAYKVAEAAGGLLGLGSKISKAERALIDELERAFA